MVNKSILGLLWILDYLTGKSVIWVGYVWSKFYSIRGFPQGNALSELHYLREEIRRLRFANSIMRQELNRVKMKRPCLCKKLQIIYFKMRFNISFRKIKRYLPISKTAVMRYLNQLRSGLSNLMPWVRGFYTSSQRTPISIAQLIREIHRENPYWGRWKIALAIWRIGVYVSPSTVRNILNAPESDYRRPKKEDERAKMRAINGKYPNHIWSIDLTTIYILFRPLYVISILDHYSRKVLCLCTTFNPTAEWVIQRTNQAILRFGKPKHLISDYGSQFTAGDFKDYMKDQRILHRYAKISKANGNSKVERFFRSLKYEFLNLFLFGSRDKADRLLNDYLKYYNEYRPHEALDGQTPDEVYSHKPRDKPPKDAKMIKGPIETIRLGEGLLRAYQLKRIA